MLISLVALFGGILGWNAIGLKSRNAPLVVACLTIATLYVASLFNILLVAKYCIVAIGFSGIVLALTRARLRDLAGWCSRGPIVFVILAIGAMLPIALRTRHYQWDDFSHWGLIVKYLEFFDRLPTDTSLVYLPTYPPGASLFAYFFQWGSYDESYVHAAQVVLIALFVSPIFNGLSSKRFVRVAVGALCVFLLFHSFGLDPLNLSVDHVVAALAGGALVAYWQDRQAVGAWLPALLSACLVMPLLKDSGLLLAAMVASAVAFDQSLMALRRQASVKGVLLSASFVLLAFGSASSWQLHLKSIGIENVAVRGTLSDLLAAAVDNKPGHERDVIHSFAKALYERPIGEAVLFQPLVLARTLFSSNALHNPTFMSDVPGWQTSGAWGEYGPNGLLFGRTGGDTGPTFYQEIPVLPGVKYKASLTFSLASASEFVMRIYDGAKIYTARSSKPEGVLSIEFVPTGSSVRQDFYAIIADIHGTAKASHASLSAVTSWPRFGDYVPVVRGINISFIHSYAIILASLAFFGLLGWMPRSLAFTSAAMFTVFSAVYLTGLLFLYVYRFGSYEGTNLASFSRYTSAIVLPWLIAILSIVIGRPKSLAGSTMLAAVTSILMLLAPASATPIGSIADTQSIERREAATAIARQAMNAIGDARRVYNIWQGSNGFESWVLHFEEFPRVTNFDRWSFGEGRPEDIWRYNLSIGEFARELSGYDRLLLAAADASLWSKYGGLFDKRIGCAEAGVYDIEKRPDGVHLTLIQRFPVDRPC